MRRPFTFESLVSEPESQMTSRACSFSNIDRHSSSTSEDDLSIGSICRPVVRKVELKRSITLFGVIVILISNIGGTGIFIAPSTILQLAGSPGLTVILWSVGGLIQAFLACSVAELTQFFGNTGGPYFFISCVFGNCASFVFLWSYLIFITAPLWALAAYTASLYLLSLVFTDCPPSEGLVKLLAAWILISVIIINCTFMAVITCIQKLLTSCKVFVLVLIIFLGLMSVTSDAGQENISHLMDESTEDAGKIALSLLAGYFGFGGWIIFIAHLAYPQVLLYSSKPIITILAEEVKSPEKNLPRGLGVSFAVLIATTVSANFAYYTVLSTEESLRSNAVAILFGQKIHPAMPVVIAVLVFLCSIGTLNILILSHPRMIYAAARNGHMPKIMTMLQGNTQSPWPATVTLGLLSIMMLVSGSVRSLIETISFYSGIMMLVLLMCLLTLRWRQPGTPRYIKIPVCLSVLAFLLTAVLVTLSAIETPRRLGSVAIIVFLGILVYFLCVRLRKPGILFRFVDLLGFYLQMLFHLRYDEK